MDKRPIGVFDSGVGGLTVVDKIFRFLPNERIIYFGDTARVPYGNKSKETVTRFSKEIIEFLLGFNVKLIVIACNTACSLSIETLRRSCRVPVLGVIEPGVEKAVTESKTGRIGVIGTESTISSNVYEKKIKSFGRKFFVVQKSCPLFVPLAENGWLGGEITFKIAKKYLLPVLKKRIDTLILGCTHYPLLKNTIKEIAGDSVRLVDSSVAAVLAAKSLLGKQKMAAGPGRKVRAKFFTSDDAKNFEKLARVFLGKKIKAKRAAL